MAFWDAVTFYPEAFSWFTYDPTTLQFSISSSLEEDVGTHTLFNVVTYGAWPPYTMFTMIS